MTVVVSALASFVAFLLATASVVAGDRTTDRVRAQAAADSAALAAVAESAPHGGSDPLGTAEKYARLNGAEIVHCTCEPGGDSVELIVEVGDARAAARAVIDPDAFDLAIADEGLNPDLQVAVDRLIAASDGKVHVVSGFRTQTEQATLWNEALARYGDPEVADDWVARPGSSMHNRGLAVDLGGDLALALSLIDRFGLPMYRPLANEPWHFELVGSRP
jgi:D-alanyl-D-alanine carboxypeptidase